MLEPIPINEAVIWLNKNDPELGKDLRNEFGSLSDEFDDLVLGPASAATKDRAGVYLETVRSARQCLQTGVRKLVIRAKQMERYRFWGEVAGAVGSSSVIGTLFFFDSNKLAIASALVALAGTLAPIIRDHKERQLLGQGSISDVSMKLSDLEARAFELLVELPIALQREADEDRVRSLTVTAKDFMKDMNKLKGEYLGFFSQGST